jgi:hypothetical protein
MSRKVGQIIARGERRWLVRVYLGRDRETRRRAYHNRTIYGSLRHAQAYLTRRLHKRDSVERLQTRVVRPCRFPALSLPQGSWTGNSGGIQSLLSGRACSLPFPQPTATITPECSAPLFSDAPGTKETIAIAMDSATDSPPKQIERRSVMNFAAINPAPSTIRSTAVDGNFFRNDRDRSGLEFSELRIRIIQRDIGSSDLRPRCGN